MDEKLKEDTLTAIALVTAAQGEPGNPKTLSSQVANDYLDEHPEDGHTRLASGLINLCSLLVVKVSRATGESLEAVLQDSADLVNNWGEYED